MPQYLLLSSTLPVFLRRLRTDEAFRYKLSTMELQEAGSPMDDKIQCLPGWTAEDRVQALFLVASNSDPDYDSGYEQLKVKRKVGRKHKMKWMKKPMAVSEVLLELQDTDFRENAMRALSSYLMQAREKLVIEWALQSDIVDVCLYAIQIGSELSKLISMYILESILQTKHGISAICEPTRTLLEAVAEMCANLVTLLAAEHGFSPRLLFHVIRCYILLTQNSRALEMLKICLPPQLQNDTFQDLLHEFPTLARLLHQLLLNVGKTQHLEPHVAFCSHPPKVDRSDPLKSPRDLFHPLQPINLNALRF